MWQNGGRTPAALALHYWRGKRKATMAQVTELAELCVTPDAMSFSQAFRALKVPGATESAYRYATPKRLRVALAALLAHRRQGQVLERLARQRLQEVAG